MTLRHLRRWHRAVLLFLALFCLSVIIQFAVGWYQRRAAAQDQLWHWATEVTKDVVYTGRWNLMRFRQSFPDASHYYVLDRSGLIIDIEGFLPEFPIKVDLTHQVPGIHSVSVSQTNESWRLLVSRMDKGFLFLGVSPPEDITNVDERLHKTAKRFGSSLREALRVKDNEIDKNIDYAIVADDGSIENAAGGIPLEAVRTPAIAPNKIVDIRTSGGATFGALLVPIESTSRQPVGDVLVFGRIPPRPWYVLRTWLINVSSSALLALIGTLISIPYLGEHFRPEKLLEKALHSGESTSVEFKQALRWDQWPDVKGTLTNANAPKRKPPDAEAIVVKSIAAFLNAESGGTLLIGIADDKRVVGLDGDYSSLGKRESRDQDRDRFQVHLGNLLSQKIGRDLSSLYVKYTILGHDNKDVCVIHVSPSPRPVYISEGDVKTFYVRHGVSTVSLDVEKAVTYIERRWPRALWRKVRNVIRMVRS